MGSAVGALPKIITDAKNTTGKFVVKLQGINNNIIYGKKTIDAFELATANKDNPKDRKKLLNNSNFLKDPSINSLTSVIRTLNGFEICNPASFALSQAFPSGSEGADVFNRFQGKVREIFEEFRNFSLAPGVGEVTGATTDTAVKFENNQGFSVNLPPLKNNSPYPINEGTILTLKSNDPRVKASMRASVVTFEGNVFDVKVNSASTQTPPKDPDTKEDFTTNKFDIDFTKTQNSDVVALSAELESLSEILREIGYQDILNDLNNIPRNFPGVGKIREKFIEVGDFLNKTGKFAAQAGDEASDASQFLAGNLTSRQVLEGSRLFGDLYRQLEPIVNFQNTLVTGYKDTIEDLNSVLRNAIPFEELSKFVQFVTNFARVIQGVVSMLIALLKTIQGIIKILTTILKVFKVVIKVIKVAIIGLPSLFTTVGIIQTISDKVSLAEGALDIAILFLEIIDNFISAIILQLTITKQALQILIDEGAKFAAKLGSCASLKGNGMEPAMAGMVSALRDSLRGLTGAGIGEDYYPDDPNAPGRGLQSDKLPDGVGSFVRLPNGEIMFVNDSIIGFDADGNLIFYGNLTSLSTGVNFNDTLGQDFRNRNLKYYTFDKFRNSQADMLNEGDRIANERNNRIKEIDPTDRFGNFAEIYKGYTIKIQEEIEDNVNAQTATRRRGIAFDSVEKIVVSSDLTFSNDLSQIVNEVKFLIDRAINEGIIGINTSDTQANEPSDDDVIDVVESIGGDKVAVSNLRAEKNNKIAANITSKQGNPTKSRIGNQPLQSNANQNITSRGKTDGGSPTQPISTTSIGQTGLDEFIKETPSLNNLANNLGTINRATTGQLSNILKEPGIENMTEEELIEKVKGDILSGLDPNPEKIEEVKAKTQQWYQGIRARASADFQQLKIAAVMTKKPDPLFEPYVTKIELKEIPKWIKLLRRKKYTQAEIDAGLTGEGIRDKYEIKVNDDGKIDIRKKLAFKEGNFNSKKRG